jgi:hypothetical protein
MDRRDFLKTTLIGAGSLGLASGLVPYSSAFAQNFKLTELIQFIKGDLPILITVPHGGTELVYTVSPRYNLRRPIPSYSVYSAIWTYEIALFIMDELKLAFGGKRPYMVMNLSHRRYLDVNREPDEAYEDKQSAKRVYDEYHSQIREYINRLNIIFKKPLMIDLSGHLVFPDRIVRRTKNGDTLQGFEDIQIAGGDSILGYLSKLEYIIDPPLNKVLGEVNDQETDVGSYSLEEYGKYQEQGIDMMQLVIGKNLRRSNNYEETGRDIGKAIVNFMKNNMCNDLKRAGIQECF